jgi:hypothetical protein
MIGMEQSTGRPWRKTSGSEMEATLGDTHPGAEARVGAGAGGAGEKYISPDRSAKAALPTALLRHQSLRSAAKLKCRAAAMMMMRRTSRT